MKKTKVTIECILRKGYAALALFLCLFTQTSLQGAWEPPEFVSDTSEPISTVDGPVLSVNPSGNAIAVWRLPGINTSLVKSSFYTRGGSWSPPVIISSLALNIFDKPIYVSQGDPDIFMNASNYAVAVWEASEFLEDIEENAQVVVSATSINGVWSPVQRISSIAPADLEADIFPENPVVAVNDSGLAVVAYKQSIEIDSVPTGLVMASFLPFGGTWSTPVQISSEEIVQIEHAPDIAMDPNGNVVVVWRREYQGGYGVEAATFDSVGGTWSGPVTLNGVTNFIEPFPKTAIDYNGNAVAIWTRDGGSSLREVVVAYFTYGVGWGTPIVLFESDELTKDAYVVLDPAGNATATWESGGQIYSSRLPLGGSWRTPRVISEGTENYIDTGFVQHPLAVDLDGNAIAIWGNNDGFLKSGSYFFGFGWQPPENIFNPASDTHMNIGLASCGFAVALWTGTFDTNPVVQAAVNFNLFTPVNFRGKRCCDHFVHQKRCLNILKWDPFPDCILFYRLYRDGELIEIFSSEGPFRFVDPLRCCKKDEHEYSLTSINTYGYESDPAIFVLP